MITIKSDREIELMKEACRVAALAQKEIEKNIRPGISTYELDLIAEETMKKNGAIPAEKGYPSGIKGVPDFPASTCMSVNALKNGFHGDCARTYIVGEGTPEAKRLVEVTKKAFFEGIKFAKKGNRIGDISNAIGEFVKKNGYSVVREFQGHGIGREMHEEPGIPNYGKAGRGPRLEVGMTLAVEPMVMEGDPEIWELEDGWTIVTADGKLAAHYENTILITEKEPKVLTIL